MEECVLSNCIFFASDYPLPEVVPSQKYSVEVNVDNGTIEDGGADDNFFLYRLEVIPNCTDKPYAVCLEWNYTDGRAEQIVKYIKEILKKTESMELWHIWLMDYYEYEDSPVIRKKVIQIDEMTMETIKELDNTKIWNCPDKYIPSSPSFYCFTVKR